MRMSDLIEEFIKDLFDDTEDIEIQRNDLAEHFNCVPSQINYVLTTRFTYSSQSQATSIINPFNLCLLSSP